MSCKINHQHFLYKYILKSLLKKCWPPERMCGVCSLAIRSHLTAIDPLHPSLFCTAITYPRALKGFPKKIQLWFKPLCTTLIGSILRKPAFPPPPAPATNKNKNRITAQKLLQILSTHLGKYAEMFPNLSKGRCRHDKSLCNQSMLQWI